MNKVIRNPNAFLRYVTFCLKQYAHYDLVEYASEDNTDKGVSGHDYIRVYDFFLREKRCKPLTFCEIGLSMQDSENAEHKDSTLWKDKIYETAPSLNMWRKYLPYAHLIGFDIRTFKKSNDPQVHIVQGDQSSREELQRIIDHRDSLDVIIDDGLHASRHQQITFAYLFAHLKSGGLFFIEDLGYQPEEFEEASIPRTVDLLKILQSIGKWNSPLATAEEKQIIEEQVASVYMYDSRKSPGPEFTDYIAVIVKK